MTKTMNIDDLILLADAFVLPVDVKVSHGLFRRGVSLGSVLRSIKTHAQCQTATAYDEGNMEEIARDSDLAEIEALRKRIDFAADALGVVERRRDTLKAERDTARAALRIFVSRAKSWHDFHHGSDTIQCDALCEAIPIGEAALGSPHEPNCKDVGDAVECALRVEITSDTIAKVIAARDKVVALILDSPADGDFMVTIHEPNEHPPAAPQRGTPEPTALATGEGADTGVCPECLGHGWRRRPFTADDSGECPGCGGSGRIAGPSAVRTNCSQTFPEKP